MKKILFKDVEKRTDYDAYESKPGIPDGITFHVSEKPELQNKVFSLTGWLVNRTDKKQEVHIFPIGAQNGFSLWLWGAGISMKPHEGPYQVPPPPMAITIPPKTEIEVVAFLRLDDYEIGNVKEAELRWKFHFWSGKCPEGSFRVSIQ